MALGCTETSVVQLIGITADTARHSSRRINDENSITSNYSNIRLSSSMPSDAAPWMPLFVKPVKDAIGYYARSTSEPTTLI
jgi:hypothetical protein